MCCDLENNSDRQPAFISSSKPSSVVTGINEVAYVGHESMNNEDEREKNDWKRREGKTTEWKMMLINIIFINVRIMMEKFINPFTANQNL